MAYIDNPNGFYFDGMMDGGDTVPILSQALDASQTVVHGDLLIIASGYIQIAAHDSASLLGLAIEDLTNPAATYTRISYIPLYQGVLVVAQCSGTPVRADMLTGHAFEGATGVMELNEDDDAPPALIPMDIVDRDEGLAEFARLRCFCNRSVFNISA